MSPLGDKILINVLCFVTAPIFVGLLFCPTVILNEVKDLNKNYKTLTI